MSVNNWRVNLAWPEGVFDSTNRPDVEYLYEDAEGKTVSSFHQDTALAAMILADQVFINSNWWEDEWPEAARETVAICVNTSDVFAWGVADGETITYAEIEEVYRYFAQDQAYGTTIWALIRNRELPQKPVADSIRKAGKWNLEELQVKHGLRANRYDGISGVLARRKYATYCAWCTETHRKSLPYDAGWWDGWREFTEANPNWNDAAWCAEDHRLCNEWRLANGYDAREELK